MTVAVNLGELRGAFGEVVGVEGVDVGLPPPVAAVGVGVGLGGEAGLAALEIPVVDGRGADAGAFGDASAVELAAALPCAGSHTDHLHPRCGAVGPLTPRARCGTANTTCAGHHGGGPARPSCPQHAAFVVSRERLLRAAWPVRIASGGRRLLGGFPDAEGLVGGDPCTAGLEG